MREDLILRNVTVVDGSGGPPRTNVEVAIAGETFAAIRPTGSGPAGAKVVERGGYLIPGLWEGHTHLRMRPGETATDQVARLEGILADYLAAGITTVLELGGPLDIDGRLREKHRNAPSTETAELFFAGPCITGINGWPLHLHGNHSLVREAGDAETGRRTVLELGDETDFVKCMYHGTPGAPDKLPRAALEAIVDAAHERGKRVLVHIRTKRDVEEVVDAGADGIEHAFIPENPNDLSEAEEVARLLARTGTYFSPTFTVLEMIARTGDRAYLHELARDGIISAQDAERVGASKAFNGTFPEHPADETLMRLRYGMRALPIMRDAGVKISAGSDHGLFTSRPSALMRELQLLAQAGLSGGEIVVAATRHQAEKIGKDAKVGTIAAGQLADAVLLDADPLADVMHLVRPEHRVATLRRGRLQYCNDAFTAAARAAKGGSR